MKELSDIELLDAYTREHSEDAFRELVARHLNFIYSVALRQLRNPHLAEEATQSAFIALAGKAGQLRRRTVIAGWLHRAVHFAALKLQRSEARRKRWEERAATMDVPGDTNDAFQEVALPHVDGALAELSEHDRDAVVLRFLQQQSFRDVAQSLGTSEDAAKKRVGRALSKLRSLLMRRGIAISVAALAAGLSQMPVTAAPAGLASNLASLPMSTVAPTSSIGATILNFVATAKARFAVGGVVLLGAVVALLWLNRTQATTGAVPKAIRSSAPRVKVTSVLVDDQDKALTFYTTVLGFLKKTDVPTGEPGGARWLTVVSPEEPDGTELVLEPMGFAPARTYQKALFEAGIPLAAFATEDVQKQFERLKSLGVKFSTEPTAAGPTTMAVFEDTCGNRIQIFQTPSVDNALTSPSLRIKLSSVLVDDQDRALKFYTEVLGFAKKREIPGLKWLTVVSPEEPQGTELLLEPRGSSAASTFTEALHKAGIPQTQFEVTDVQDLYERLTRRGVVFQMKPTKMGPVTMAMFDDTCGNFIQLIQK
jgi:RNA polymerase sigma factor (sigma-70 family)